MNELSANALNEYKKTEKNYIPELRIPQVYVNNSLAFHRFLFLCPQKISYVNINERCNYYFLHGWHII